MATSPQVKAEHKTKISVIVTSYNHERYIQQCLDSILIQKGNFDLEIILGDDFSTDKTREIMQQYYELNHDVIVLIPEEPNLGLVRNLQRCLQTSTGDYIAICEGDDYWTDEFKLQKQMKFLEEHRSYSMCFSAIMLFIENENRFQLHEYHKNIKTDTITTKDLIERNYIGNFSCCMYRAEAIKKLPETLFDIPFADWMFNMVCGEVGKIGFLKDPMSVYRLHSKGMWSGAAAHDQINSILSIIDTYNKFFNYKYRKQFMKLKKRMRGHNS